ncbi:hypothetical protein B0A49_02280 [Cryomyces minteri]|uniref:Alpha-carbonic anhydrase domain-containing protein n=1 Tax=Cryomyces minteri TaxID=331657 RepID=A0A4U0XTJ0_9PEZI|nr:hypothetical protein B0A49_02280 [Cryomyces minteri]
MHFTNFAVFSAIVFSTVLACPDHSNHELLGPLYKRQTVNGTFRVAPTKKDWAYEASYNWGMVNENYTLCQVGTQQAPIPLLLTQGLSLNHIPHFQYPATAAGNFYNWGYGPAFTFSHPPGNWTGLPSLTFEEAPGVNETVYLRGWHLHAPADHSVQGDRSKAELHLVHVDAKGHERAVLAFRVDPGNAESAFFGQLPGVIGFNETDVQEPIELDPSLALNEVNSFNEFWTYRGSLTSPPCTEGLRWYVARNILFTSVAQMQSLLRASTYSARAEQEVWLHQINV